MKKLILIILTVWAALVLLTGCGGQAKRPEPQAAPKEKPLRVVATVFPIFDWTREILGEGSRAELTLLLDRGVDLHSYQPSAQDIMKISTCDVFIYVGGESDAWVKDALREAVNKDMVVVNLMDVLGSRAKTEEHREGMETEHHHDHDAHADRDVHDAHGHKHEAHEHKHDGHGHGHEAKAPERDEHVWMSLRNAALFTDAIAEALTKADAQNAERYAKNAAAYKEKLAALDADYTKATEAAPRKTLLFGDRFPFRYLVDDYGLTYYAAFPGCSAETEASFETIAFLAGKLDELRLPVILVTESRSHKIAEAIVQNTASPDRKILVLDSMQSETLKASAEGNTYLSVMRKNLEVLKEALR